MGVTLKQLQEYIKFKDYHPERGNDYMLKLFEEVGELARAVLRKYPSATEDKIKDTIEEEIYDVIYYALAIANIYDIDIEKWIPIKERYTDKKYGTNYFESSYYPENLKQYTFNEKFWTALDVLYKESVIEIDRPKGTAHPKLQADEMIYPVDYGYLKGTKSPDNADIDVFIGSEIERGIDAVICTVDLYKKDSEIKILIGCTEEEKKAVYRIYTSCYETLQGVLIRR